MTMSNQRTFTSRRQVLTTLYASTETGTVGTAGVLLLILLISLGSDFLHENRARPRRCCDASHPASCEEDDEEEDAADEPSEPDFESSDSLSEHKVDSIFAT